MSMEISKKYDLEYCIILLTCDVATSPRWTNNCDGFTDGVCQLEVAVNEVADLYQDSRPIDAVDGAKIVLRHVVRVREHGLDGNIQVV